MKDVIINAEDVRFSYVTAEGVAPIVLDGVSLSIEEGSFVAVLGHNGSGKSTLAKIIRRILHPHQRRILLDGRTSPAWTSPSGPTGASALPFSSRCASRV